MKAIELTDEERRWLFKELTSTHDRHTRTLCCDGIVDFTKYEKLLLEPNIRLSKSILEKL